MLFSSSLRLASLWTATLLTGSWASPVNQNAPQRRQNAAPIAVTGLAGQSIQPRLEIRELQQNADMWNVYLLGLTRLQQVDQNDFLSHFQLAGSWLLTFIPVDLRFAYESF
jgi:tyrosinase